MAIDSSIALSYQPPQIQVQYPQPLQQFGQILSLQNLMQQRQLLPIELQTKQLQLDQLRRQVQEQQDYAAWLKSQLDPSTAQGPTAAPLPALTGQPPAVSALPALTGQAPSYPPLATAPSGLPDTAAGQVPAIPWGTMNDVTQPPVAPVAAPAPSLAAMMTTPAPAPAVPAPVAAAPSAPAGLNIGKIIEGTLTRFPTIGPTVAQNFLKTLTDQQDLEIKQHDNNAKAAGELAGIGIAIRDSKDPAAQFPQGIWEAVNKKLIPEATAQQMLADGYDKHKNDIQAFIDRAQTAQTQSEIAKNTLAMDLDSQKQAAKDIRFVNNQDDYNNFLTGLRPNVRAHFPATFSPQIKDVIQGLETAPGEAFQQGAAKTAQMAQLLGDRSQIPDFIKQQPAEVQPYLQKLYDSGITLNDFKQYAGLGALKPEAGVTVPKPAGVIAQEIGLTGAKKIAEIGAESQAYDPIVQSVLKGDVKLQDLPADLQGKIMRPLIQSGYTGLGKRVSDTELAQIDAYNNALSMLRSNQKDLQDPTNRSYEGIASGVLAHVPFVRDQINKIQGDLSLTQQKLKGFVTNKQLRGLNEDTLEKTFPSITLTPGVNDYRINKLIQSVEQERDQYMRDLTAGGKVLPTAAPAAAPPAPAETPATNAPAWQSPVKIEIQKPGGSATVQLSPAQQTAVPATPAPPGKIAAIKPDGRGGWKGGFINAKDVGAARRQGVIVP